MALECMHTYHDDCITEYATIKNIQNVRVACPFRCFMAPEDLTFEESAGGDTCEELTQSAADELLPDANLPPRVPAPADIVALAVAAEAAGATM